MQPLHRNNQLEDLGGDDTTMVLENEKERSNINGSNSNSNSSSSSSSSKNSISISSIDHDIPRDLLECEIIDMTDEYLDPFEWTVRKLIPIPKQYYWDNEKVDAHLLPTKLKLWHRSVAALGSLVRWTDRIGKPIVDTLGLTSSRFDHVTSNMTDRDWEYSRRVVTERLSGSDTSATSTDPVAVVVAVGANNFTGVLDDTIVGSVLSSSYEDNSAALTVPSGDEKERPTG